MMKAEFNISLTFTQILNLVRQLPGDQKVKLSKELEKDAVDKKLSQLLRTFKTDELSFETIQQETEAARIEIYEQSKKR